ncbi:T7SS effector LXG polymorphic toxin [Metabacillus halosaccharovorans]|uniref:T7SS effector LXG polymorphic toxin n=1 Tax=Metabacillus halosaccharovorans TaxID=930124 RepID=A0ABT3DDG6_9BACI|nr:T7SS effector LXG polymorphic toxin [Metabacillus halosaccharovorans]MCV9885110.1 T7SS effector LXG polymorphic toxin [Metabacillus halosaccharovorans]
MKVLETKTLIESMEDRAKVYTDFRDKIDTLKKEFTDITQLDDALQGKGADAIKGFYQAQIDVADALLRLVDMQIAFLNGVSGAIADIDLSGDTVVDVNFLETDLSIHASNHISMVESQREDLQKIIDGIDDIVNLEAFSADDFNTAMDDATKKRENTIKDVDALDQQLLEEYKVSESAEFHIGALFQQLLEATAQGNTISPINFDAQAYKASEAYQLSDEVQQYADDYLSFKEDQEKIREELKKAEELENRPIYEKAWDTVKTFTGEATGYYDFLRAKDGVDPVTGEELTDGQRVAAGAMATAGFIPVVGWGGRLFKGGSAIYKTAKGMNTAEQALSVYKTTSTFSNLQKAELGIYGLASANGLSEYITGKDMFGNELTDVQRQSSLFNSILGASLVASPFVPALVKNGKLVKEETLNQMHKLATNTKASARYVYDEVRGGMQALLGNQNMNLAFSGADGVKPVLSNVMNSQEIKKRIEEAVSRFSFGKNLDGSKRTDDVVTKGTGNRLAGESEVKTLVLKGEQFTNGRKNRLKPNIRYQTGEYDYFYQTDNAGRIVKFETENLQLTKREERLPHSKNTPGKVKGQDHAGHLAADRFGGSPKIDNLVSQLSDVNLKQYKKIEDEWAAALKETPPKEVKVNVEIIYDGNSKRPSEFIVEYEIDGRYEEINILN